MPKIFSTISAFIRSAAFYIVMIVVTVPYGLISLCLTKAPLDFRYDFIRGWTRFMVIALRFICGIRYKIIGADNIPPYPCVILAKHQSAYETFLFPNIFNRPTIILKKELLHIPFFGWGLRLLEPIALDRRTPSSSMEQVLSVGSKRLMEGRPVLIFPESTRVVPGRKTKYRIGGAMLAYKTQVPVLPVAHNAGNCWPGKSFLKYPGLIKVVIGAPIDVTGLSPEEILAQTKSRIESTMEIINTLKNE